MVGLTLDGCVASSTLLCGGYRTRDAGSRYLTRTEQPTTLWPDSGEFRLVVNIASWGVVSAAAPEVDFVISALRASSAGNETFFT